MNIVVEANEYRFRNAAKIIKDLPLGVFTFQSSMFGPYLSKGDDLILPETIYKNDKHFITHVLTTWNNSEDSIGILLTGKKGLGKSFTANVICANLAQKLPVIKITKEVSKNDGLIELLNDIRQDHIIYIDEFEKIFSSRDSDGDSRLNQKVFLSFLDGGNANGVKKLFIITTNNPIDELFINRPSRLRYVRQYEYLHIDTIREVIEARLINKDYLNDLLENVDQDSINIDILIKVIDEINLHNIPYSTFKDFFNYKIPEVYYDVSVKIPGREKSISIDPMDATYLNRIKNCSIKALGFGDLSMPNGDYYDFTWRQVTCGDIQRIDAKTYILKLEATFYRNEELSTSSLGEGEDSSVKFIVEATISKQMKTIIF